MKLGARMTLTISVVAILSIVVIETAQGRPAYAASFGNSCESCHTKDLVRLSRQDRTTAKQPNTPKHGSWLNMAEIEIGVLSRQCLSAYIPTKGQMVSEVAAWEQRRNQADATVDWRFTTTDAHVKLKRLYPVL
jgi:hypothetical protein